MRTSYLSNKIQNMTHTSKIIVKIITVKPNNLKQRLANEKEATQRMLKIN